MAEADAVDAAPPRGAPAAPAPEEAAAPALILGCGSLYTRAGFAGEAGPRTTFTSVVGHAKVPGVLAGGADVAVGSAALAQAALARLAWPVGANGRVADWGNAEVLWRHAFYGPLGAAPDEHAVLLLDVGAAADRERALERLFEVFGVPAAYVLAEPLGALYAAGRTSGVVVDVGDAGARVDVVLEGRVLRRAARTTSVGGRRVAQTLCELLAERGVRLPLGAAARGAVEVAAFVSADFYGDCALDPASFSMRHALPDGSDVQLRAERFRAAEAVFAPTLVGVDEDGLARVVQAAIRAAPLEARPALYANIVAAGGASMLRGLPERLSRELTSIAGVPVDVVAPPSRGELAWRGGAALAARPAFQGMWVTREEFRELGAEATVARRCF